MHQPLLGEKVAVLIANGFCERDLTSIQRELQKAGAYIRLISMDHGLVNSWNGSGWGLHFAADRVLNTALGADYSVLIIPGGQRSIDKLKLTAHTPRFIKSFFDTRKPVVACDEALELLLMTGDVVKGRTVSGPEKLRQEAQEAGAVWSEALFEIDENLMTGGASEMDRESYTARMTAFLTGSFAMAQAA